MAAGPWREISRIKLDLTRRRFFKPRIGKDLRYFAKAAYLNLMRAALCPADPTLEPSFVQQHEANRDEL
jgi:hypothetical protein